MMEELKKITAEDIKKVDEAIGEATTMLGAMGNNDSEFDRMNQIKNDFLEGKILAEEAVNRIRAIPWNKQQGTMS